MIDDYNNLNSLQSVMQGILNLSHLKLVKCKESQGNQNISPNIPKKKECWQRL